ncbi:hypothetical protein CAEBREN_09726 [Caenorhabditis brenneri]|uniref:Zinc finger PHD-type domain-containing protein n=1 Tax=Caenorhabditis brenneri TaxID=135651 RepID=G0N5V4_CAEBE|nr:hypothetical protein CAEBREN_09726 [Caenorhabditis brenneri]
MGRKTNRVNQNLSNLKSTGVAKKWKDKYEDEKQQLQQEKKSADVALRNLDDAKLELEREKKSRVELEQEIVVLKEENEQLKVISNQLEEEVRQLKERNKQLQLELEFHETENEELTLSLNNSVMEVTEVSKSLEITKIEADNMKSCHYLNTLKTAERCTELREKLVTLEKTNAKLSDEIEKEKSSSSTKIEPLGRYSAAHSAYKQMKVVRRCISGMKAAAENSIDYKHLITNILKHHPYPDSSPIKLTAEQTFVMKSVLHISDNSMKKMKRLLKNFLGFDVLESRISVAEFTKLLKPCDNYNIDIIDVGENSNGKKEHKDSIRFTIKSLETGIVDRLRILEDNKLLLGVQDEVTLCLLADKGSDETKVCVAIENTEHPNSPNNLLLAALFEGNDNEKDLRTHCSDVFKQWNDLEKIEFTTASGNVMKLLVKKKICGDMKCLSSLLGHQGQRAGCPCYACEMKWPLSGKKMLTLADADFSIIPVLRSVASYARDSKTGSNNVIKGSTTLCKEEPEDFVVATIHTIMGIFDKYFQSHINGQVNVLDGKDLTSGDTMKSQKIDHQKLVKEEEAMKLRHDALIKAQEEAYCTAVAYKNVIHNPVMHLKHPQPLCSASICIINHLSNTRLADDWIRCQTCKKYYHFSCTSLFHPESKIEACRVKKFVCCDCQHVPLSDRLSTAISSEKSISEEIPKVFAKMSQTSQKRSEVEGILFRSTGENRKQLESFLSKIGCDPRTWYASYTGNQIRKLLRPDHIDSIFDLLPKSPQNDLVKDALLLLAEIMSYSNNIYYSDSDIDVVESKLQLFLGLMKKAFPTESVTPKMHMLAFHLIPYMRKHHTWGRTSEQSIEHYHAKYNKLKTRFQPIRNLKLRAALILQDLAISNYLFDTGAWVN